MLEGIHLFHLEIDVAVDEVLGEHVALLQELMIGLQILQRFTQRAANLRHLRQFFRRQGIEVLVHRTAGWILFSMPSRPAISMAA